MKKWPFLVVVLFFIKNAAFAHFAVKDIFFLKDSASKFTINDILNSDTDKRFIKPSAYDSLKSDGSSYWYKFKVNPLDEKRDGCFLFVMYFVGSATIYLPQNNGSYIASEEIGLNIPYPAYTNWTSPYVPFSIDTAAWYYMQLKLLDKTISRPINGIPVIPSDYALILYVATRDYFYVGSIVSIIFFIGFFTLFLFIRIREKMFFFYFLYLLSAGLFILAVSQILFKHIKFIEFDYWDVFDFYALFYSAMTISQLLYTKSFLNILAKSRFFNLTIYFLILIKTGLFICGVSFNRVFEAPIFHKPIYDTLLLVPAFLFGIYAWYKGQKSARFFILAFAIIFLAYIIHSMGLTSNLTLVIFQTFGVGYNFFYELLIVEILLFTIAVVEKFRNTRKEKEIAMKLHIKQLEENARLKESINLELEDKVKERTKQLEEQAGQIARMNEILKEHNLKLEANVTHLAKAHVTHQPASLEEFKRSYPDEEACLKYLVELKWNKGFACKKCGNDQFIPGKSNYSRRCNKCWYEETPTVGTIFHKLKFPIEKAFYLLFMVIENRKISIEELAIELNLSERTCWSYKNKIITTLEGKTGKNKRVPSWENLIVNS